AFLYKIWWVRTALSTGANLFNDPNVYYPFGFNFGRGEPTLPNTIPGALIALFAGDAAGYNLVLLAGFVLSGLGTYALARTLGAGRTGALLAGLVFMLAPYRLAQTAGHLQIAATQWIPWTLFFAERALRRGRGQAALAGLCFGLTALTAWYYAIIGGFLVAGYVVLRLVWSARRQPGEPATLVRGREALVALLLFVAVAGVVIGPGLVAALGAAGEASLTHSAKAADENSASLADYVIPNELHPLWGAPAMRAHAPQNIIEDSLYLGLPAVLLAALALWPGRDRRRGADIWLVLAAVCLVLSLGLTLRVLPGVQVQVGGAPVPLPARLLFEAMPGFNSLRAYARFAVGVSLAVAVLAAVGTTRLLARPRLARARLVVAAGLLGAVLIDFWSAPYPWGTTTVAPDAVAGWLAGQAPGGAVLRLPITTAIAGPPLYAGTAYGHPLAYGYETFEPPGFRAARPLLARFPDPAAFALLRQWGVRYVVVAASSYGADWATMRATFDALPDWTRVYQAAQPVIYDAPYYPADIQTDLRAAFAPDELVVYQLR
ncbi:MAG TPA: hypothetical protein VM536_17360, partial [Chloroflexia bacterium]|nr:hypothetical protein [Chloroflexia bacterium]